MSRAIQGLFDGISRTYELVNHLLTFDLDKVWRSRALSSTYRVKRGIWLDACTGTGEMAADLYRASSANTKVVAVDFSREMLRMAMNEHRSTGVVLGLADVHQLPFRDETFDLVTISFATRNLNRGQSELVHVFREFGRVLKPGGILLHLETSQPSNLAVRLIFHLYVKTIVRIVGLLIAHSSAGYSHLSQTICNFYAPNELSYLLHRCGLGPVEFRSFLFGAIALHRTIKSA